jgi:hypothetical protein
MVRCELDYTTIHLPITSCHGIHKFMLVHHDSYSTAKQVSGGSELDPEWTIGLVCLATQIQAKVGHSYSWG